MKTVRKYVSGAVVDAPEVGEREIIVVASDATPDRDQDVMVPEGVDLTNYRKNPIVLADHNAQSPIGTAQIEVKDSRVEARIQFAPEGASAKADEYLKLAKAGILKTVSVGFRPIASTPIKGGGLRYDKWELLELSVVSIPANPNAVVIARAAAETEKSDKATWKVGASRNLPIGDALSWDSAAAAASIFAHCGFDGGDPDTTYARKGFLLYDAANPADKTAYKFPFAMVVNGRLTAMPSAVRAGSMRLADADLPDDVAEKARAVLDHYGAKMTDKSFAPKIKGLYDVAQLAYLLNELGYAHSAALWESEVEGDASKVPAMLATALRALADAFVAMSAEEVSELLAGRDLDFDDDADAEIAAAPTPLAKCFVKAGRVLSAANREHMDAVCKSVASLMKCYTKAADLHDDLHARLQEMQGHMEEIDKRARAVTDSDKPAEDPETVADDDGADRELSAAAERRKRIAEAMAFAG